MTRRNISKTITYCLMHFLVAMSVAYLLSGSWEVAISIGIIEPLVQTVFYNIHESVWTKQKTFSFKH